MVDSSPSGPGSTSPTTSVPAGFGRILRDEAGNVIGIELNEGDNTDSHDTEETIEDLDPEVDETVMGRWAASLGQKNDIGQKCPGLLEGQ